MYHFYTSIKQTTQSTQKSIFRHAQMDMLTSVFFEKEKYFFVPDLIIWVIPLKLGFTFWGLLPLDVKTSVPRLWLSTLLLFRGPDY